MDDEIFRLFNEGVTHSLEAHQYRENGNGEQAVASDRKSVAAFDRVLELDARHTGALSGKAMGLAMLGQTQEAMALFRKAIEIEPDFAENYRQLGLCLLELGDISAARDVTFQALEREQNAKYRNSAAIEIYNLGGSVMMMAAQHRDAGRRSEEVQCYERAKGVFSLAQEVDPSLRPATEAIRIVNSYLLGVVDEGDSRGEEKSSKARGFWGRLFGKE